jgi:hypothetical protein
VRHLVIGMVLIALGLWGISAWWDAFAFAMRALVPLVALVIGVLAVLSSYSRMGATIDGGEAESDEHAQE